MYKDDALQKQQELQRQMLEQTKALQGQLEQQRKLQQQLQGQAEGDGLAGGDDAEIAELQAAQEKVKKQMGALNALNPIADAPPSEAGASALSMADPAQLEGLPPSLQGFVKVMRHPLVAERMRKMIKLTQDAEFMKAARAIQSNKQLHWMYIGLFVYTLLFWLLRRYALAATDRLVARLMIRLALVPVFFTGYFLVSYGILGQPLVTVLWELKAVLL